MNGSQASDVDLFERLRAGDTGALEPLMERFAARVYRGGQRDLRLVARR